MVYIFSIVLFLVSTFSNEILMKIRCLIVFLLSILFCETAIAQNSQSYALEMDEAKAVYRQSMIDPNGYLFGKEYKLYHYGLETSPLFNAALGMEGTVFSNGEAYQATLVYDIYRDELITITDLFQDHSFVVLNQSVIDSFSLVAVPNERSPLRLKKEKEFLFEKIDFDDSLEEFLKDGYYEVISDDDVIIYTHHEAIQGNNEGEAAIIHGIFRYDYEPKKILYFNNKYVEIKTKRKFLQLFPDQNKAVNKKLRSFSEPFKDLTAQQILETVKVTKSN